jgi:hypothetical protein
MIIVPEGLFSPVAKYFGTCLKYEYELNCQEKIDSRIERARLL